MVRHISPSRRRRLDERTLRDKAAHDLARAVLDLDDDLRGTYDANTTVSRDAWNWWIEMAKRAEGRTS